MGEVTSDAETPIDRVSEVCEVCGAGVQLSSRGIAAIEGLSREGPEHRTKARSGVQDRGIEDRGAPWKGSRGEEKKLMPLALAVPSIQREGAVAVAMVATVLARPHSGLVTSSITLLSSLVVFFRLQRFFTAVLSSGAAVAAE